RLDQEKGPSTPFQRPPYHSALIPGTSVNADPDSQRCLSRIEVDAETRAGTATTFEMKTVMTTGETKSRHAHSP
ncbi:hypothetical protein, partial [Bradyrhizobium diazoefficiens]|uniref:hypothetical protein n=1 Tax=Bradyrhizobium diazoefficiens TaxID=1355477 RepID=UPI001B8B1298